MTKEQKFLIEMPDHPFCIALRERREALGWSLQTLTTKVGGCSRSYIGDLEKGRYAPSVEYGLIICQALDIPTWFCMDYIKTHMMRKQELLLEREYTEWFNTIPDSVAERLLKTEGSKMVHSAYYNEEAVYA